MFDAVITFDDSKERKPSPKPFNLVLKKLVEDVLGKKRLPMIIMEKKPNINLRKSFNAKLAAIHGFAPYGYDHLYLIKDNNELDFVNLKIFLKKYNNAKKFIFGFTSSVYNVFFKNKKINGYKNYFKNSVIIHGGGWKKMEKEKISNLQFKKFLTKKFFINKVINYYGLIEQTGSIFFQCNNCNYFRNSIYSDIIIRDKNFNPINKHSKNQKGFIQLLSVLPSSYPGNSILTEDIGEINYRNNCKECGKFGGKRFLVHGRSKIAEVRGCSDA